MLNFDFLEKGLGIVSSSRFVYDFGKKIFLMLRSMGMVKHSQSCQNRKFAVFWQDLKKVRYEVDFFACK